MITWIENHFDACRRFFANDDRFLEIDIEGSDVPHRLGDALGIELVGWTDRKARTFEDELVDIGPVDAYRFRDIRRLSTKR